MADNFFPGIVILLILLVGGTYIYEAINSDEKLELGELTDKYIERHRDEDGSTSTQYHVSVYTKTQSLDTTVSYSEFYALKSGSRLTVRYSVGRTFGWITNIRLLPYAGAEVR